MYLPVKRDPLSGSHILICKDQSLLKMLGWGSQSSSFCQNTNDKEKNGEQPWH